ncbi:hypothetical protein E2C01_054098 [Portunus trituberculatus]|uniref:Uncharacterized protein n=1 Tax=Portunus trituberculatus TaxID=210409 RepID=A0A5B7GM68_PORTR|nr:hypothetical protein [Portunus trituberculatus]
MQAWRQGWQVYRGRGSARQVSWLSTGEALKVCSSERASALLFFVGALFIQNGVRKIDTRQPQAVDTVSTHVIREGPARGNRGDDVIHATPPRHSQY